MPGEAWILSAASFLRAQFTPGVLRSYHKWKFQSGCALCLLGKVGFATKKGQWLLREAEEKYPKEVAAAAARARVVDIMEFLTASLARQKPEMG